MGNGSTQSTDEGTRIQGPDPRDAVVRAPGNLPIQDIAGEPFELSNLEADKAATLELARRSFDRLRALLQTPEIWDRRKQFGVEIEYAITGADFRPVFLPEAHEGLGDTDAANLQKELLLSNLEAATHPAMFGRDALGELERSMCASQARAEAHIRRAFEGTGVEGRLLMNGMLSTYRLDDFKDTSAFSRDPRYLTFNDEVLRAREGSFQVQFTGAEEISFHASNMAHEGVPTSVQYHISAAPEEIVALYNASLIALAPALALGANSAHVFGKEGQHESRISYLENGATPNRFFISSGFAESPEDLFADIFQYAPILPYHEAELLERRTGVDKDLEADFPALKPLTDHNGTVWKWLRPCYGVDPVHGPHLRLEMRALGAGPTELDMAVDGAFFYGLTKGLADSETLPVDFEMMKEEFYQAAKSSVNATFEWGQGGEPVSMKELMADTLIPIAKKGLLALGVEEHEADSYLSLAREKVETGQNGAVWQINSINNLRAQRPEVPIEVHHQRLAECMYENQCTHRSGGEFPVSRWPLASYSGLAA